MIMIYLQVSVKSCIMQCRVSAAISAVAATRTSPQAAMEKVHPWCIFSSLFAFNIRNITKYTKCSQKIYKLTQDKHEKLLSFINEFIVISSRKTGLHSICNMERLRIVRIFKNWICHARFSYFASTYTKQFIFCLWIHRPCWMKNE